MYGRNSTNNFLHNLFSMTSLVIYTREPQIVCLWEYRTPVLGNHVPLTEAVSRPYPKGIS